MLARYTNGTAFVFPGQAAQTVGMGSDLYDYSEAARMYFDRADRLLGYKLTRLCFEGPPEELARTCYAQAAVFTTSIACLMATREHNQLAEPIFTAGHSLGEYTALVASGVMEFEQALELVAKRSQLMEAAARNNPGGMLALSGTSLDLAQEICQVTNFEIAAINSPRQIVISGPVDFMEATTRLAKQKGVIRVTTLNAGGAFHSRLMQPVLPELRAILKNMSYNIARPPLIANVSAKRVENPAEIIDELEIQLTRPVLWQQSIEYMAVNGVRKFIEFGPGHALGSFIRRIIPGAVTHSISDSSNISI